MKKLLLIVAGLLILGGAAMSGEPTPTRSVPVLLDIEECCSVANWDWEQEPADFGLVHPGDDPDAVSFTHGARANKPATVTISVPPAFPVVAELQPKGGGAPIPSLAVAPGVVDTEFELVVDCQPITYDMNPDLDYNTAVTVQITIP